MHAVIKYVYKLLLCGHLYMCCDLCVGKTSRARILQWDKQLEGMT